MTVEDVTYTDKRGHLVRVLRLRRYGVHIGDFRTVEELAAHVELSQLQEERTDAGSADARPDTAKWSQL